MERKKPSALKFWLICAGIWLVLSLALASVIGFTFRKAVLKMHPDAKFAKSLKEMADPSVLPSEFGNNDVPVPEDTRNIMSSDRAYMLAASLSDWHDEMDIGLGQVELTDAMMVVDKQGNVVRSGVVGLVEKGRCEHSDVKECCREKGFCALVNITGCFSDEQKECMKNLVDTYDNGLEIKLAQCRISGPDCYPVRAEVYFREDCVQELEFDTSKIPSDAKICKEDDLWIHAPWDVIWSTSDGLKKAQQKLQDYVKSRNVFAVSAEENKGNLFSKESYFCVYDGDYALATLVYFDLKVVALCVIALCFGSLFMPCMVVSLIVFFVSRRRRA